MIMLSLRLAALFAVVIVPCAIRADDPPKPLLPGDAVWVMKYDDQLDGEVKAKPGGEVRWELTVRNDRISGRLAGLKKGEPSGHQLSGEVVGGSPPLVTVRQDGPKGLVCYYIGKRLAADRIVGTWYDNRGSAGDFEWVVEK
jgi:hypothetical protein